MEVCECADEDNLRACITQDGDTEEMVNYMDHFPINSIATQTLASLFISHKYFGEGKKGEALQIIRCGLFNTINPIGFTLKLILHIT